MNTTVTKHLIKLPTVGKGLLSWLVENGQQVEIRQTVAHFTVGNVIHEVAAPGTGKLYCVTPSGTQMVGGNPVGRVHEGEMGSIVVVKPITDGKDDLLTKTTNTRSTVQTPPSSSQYAPSERGVGISMGNGSSSEQHRRGAYIMPLPATSEVPDLAAELVEFMSDNEGKAKKKQSRKKTKNRTYSIGEHQEIGIAKLAAELSLEAIEDERIPTVNESELVRAAVDILLSLPRPALLDVIRANKRRETEGKFGVGRPRPRAL